VKTRKFQQPGTPPGVELAPGPCARQFYERARLRGKLSGIRGSHHEKMKVQELVKTSNWKPRPGLELTPESSSSRGTSLNHTSHRSGVRARNEREKIEESEGHIAKRTKFPELKKKPTPVKSSPLGRARPAWSHLSHVSGGRVRKE
jgi:ribosome modulation factor